MELPLTTEKLIEMMNKLRSEREANLHREIRGGVTKPEYILERLQEDIREAIEKKSGRTHYVYALNTYNYLHKRFGKEDVEKAAMEMGREYWRTHFPAANAVTIDYDSGIYGPLQPAMSLNIHFNLPSPSDQTSSHLGQPK
jgi:hypothetical protein